MDYNHLIPECAVGANIWVVSNKPLHIRGSWPSSAWKGVPVGSAISTHR